MTRRTRDSVDPPGDDGERATPRGSGNDPRAPNNPPAATMAPTASSPRRPVTRHATATTPSSQRPVVVRHTRRPPRVREDDLADEGANWFAATATTDLARYEAFLRARGFSVARHDADDFLDAHPGLRIEHLASEVPMWVLLEGADVLAAEAAASASPPTSYHHLCGNGMGGGAAALPVADGTSGHRARLPRAQGTEDPDRHACDRGRARHDAEAPRHGDALSASRPSWAPSTTTRHSTAASRAVPSAVHVLHSLPEEGSSRAPADWSTAGTTLATQAPSLTASSVSTPTPTVGTSAVLSHGATVPSVTTASSSAPVATPSPPASFRGLAPFNGTAEGWLGFDRSLANAMELPAFAPGGDGLVTASANQTASSQLRAEILAAISGSAAAQFSARPQFVGKGFEMVAHLRRFYAPTDPAATFLNFERLLSSELTGGTTLAEYMERLRVTRDLILAGGAAVHPVLLNLFCLRGLGPEYANVKKELVASGELYGDITLDQIEQRCNAYTSAAKRIGIGSSPAAASAATTTPPGPSPAQAPAPAPAPTHSAYPPESAPPGQFVTAVCKNADSACPVCHKKSHGVCRCGFLLRAGYVVVKDPARAAELCKEYGLGSSRRGDGGGRGKGPRASQATASPPASTAPPHQGNDAEDGAAIAAAARATLGENGSLSDNEGGMMEREDLTAPTVSWKLQGASGSRPRGLTSKSSPAPYPHTSTRSLASACSAALHDGVRTLSPTTPPAVVKRVVHLRASTTYRLAAACLAAAAHVSACPASVTAASVAAALDVAVMDSGATHHLWPGYDAFISYRRVRHQCVTLADGTEIPILGRGAIAIELGGKRVVIRDVYHVPGLRLPLFSLRTHRRTQGCGFHSDNDGAFVFFPKFSLAVDDEIDSYVACRSLGRSVTEFDYIQPRASAGSAAAAPALRRSPRLHPPSPPVPTPSPAPPAAARETATVPDDEESDGDVELDPNVPEADTELDAAATAPVARTPRCPKLQTARINQEALRQFGVDPDAPPPDVRPCDTPNGSDSLQDLTPDKIYHLFGSRRFRNYEHFSQVSKDAKFVQGGDPCPSLGEFANLRKRKRGGPLPPSKRYLDKVHLDIVYGDTISKLGFRYALLLIDRATSYVWIYGMRSLLSACVVEALEQFRADAGSLPKQFRCDCDQKLLGGGARRWIYSEKSKIIGAPAGRQSSNGLAERAWATICAMARSYMTEKQMPRDYWYHAIHHAGRMMNCVPGKVNGKLTTAFELVHHVPPDTRTWFPLFSIVYFYKATDKDQDRTSFMSKAMQGIAVGRSTKTNALSVYNPITKQYYEPDTYKFDPSRLPCNEFPSQIHYDGGLYADLYRHSHKNVPEPYPPGMPLKIPSGKDPAEDYTTAIVSSIPIRDSEGATVPSQYLLQLHDGTTLTKTLSEMDEIADSPINKTAVSPSPSLPILDSLPSWLQHGSKVTYDHGGEFHKGFIMVLPDGTARFSCRRQRSSRQESWGVDLPNLIRDWPTMSVDNILLPSWNASSFLRPSSDTPSAASNVSANHVSARNLRAPCPPSLLKALHEDHVDRSTWLASYYEEKNGLKDNATYVEISLQEYRRLRRLPKSVPKAIPSMCVMTIKRDEHMNPDRAKSRIVVLGNLEHRDWQKSEKYAPVLQYSSLRLLTSMAVEKSRTLKQGDVKNAFCNATLPPNETTIIKPPAGDPDSKRDVFWLLKKTLYGLGRSPRHWFNMVTSILTEMDLLPSVHDPCLFQGVPSSPEDPATGGDKPLHLGIYVDDFVYFSEDPEVEHRFERLLRSKLKIDFMGTVNWFLGTHFEWSSHQDGALSVHLSQEAYAQNIVETHRLSGINLNPLATPYRSGCPIDAIPSATIDEDDKYFVKRREAYQSLVGRLTWLATNTRPDISTAVSFLASYNSCPNKQHYEAALYVVRYLRSTVSQGIAYHSSESAATSAYVHYPPAHDREAYTDATRPPSPTSAALQGFCDANWGSQIGGSVPDGEEIELFKYRSMSGFLIMRCGGPIAWKAVRQERTSRSTCEAEIRATDEAVKEILSLRNRCDDMNLPDGSAPTLLYNDNQGTVDWAKGTSTKGMRHINLKDCAVRDSVQANEIDIHHIPGNINPSDIFTKEMRDGSHFRELRESFMMSVESFRTFLTSSSAWISSSWVSGVSLTASPA